MTDPVSVNLNVTAAGAQPADPVTLWSNLITLVAGINPDYTVLPGGLIEDLASTATYAIALCDSAAVETINSLTPYGANPYILKQLGAIYGVAPGVTTNTSVYVTFSGTVGVQIPRGYLVSDGTHQYQVQDDGVVGSGGSSLPLYCVATQSGSWAVPASTVNQIISSIPPGVTLTCNNVQDGTPQAAPQTEAEYASLVLQAGLVSGKGTASILKTLLSQVPGVQPRLISVRQRASLWEIICGGGDSYQVANAIYDSGIDISALTGSVISVTGITNANPGVVTTDLNHGLTTGQANVHIAGVTGMTGVNGGPYTVTVIDAHRFSFGVDTTSSGAYVSGGEITPNARNITVDIDDYPDTYTIPFVNPPAQRVDVQMTWKTISPNFVSASVVSQLGTTAIVNFINSVPVGAPINIYALEQTFVQAVIALFGGNPSLVSDMDWTISINGVEVPPSGGTFLVYGDPESFFTTQASYVTLTKG